VNFDPLECAESAKSALILGIIGRGGGRGRVVYFIQVKPDTLECAESAIKVLTLCSGSPLAPLLACENYRKNYPIAVNFSGYLPL